MRECDHSLLLNLLGGHGPRGFKRRGKVRIDLYIYDEQGRLQPLKVSRDLSVIPRVGETISLGSRQKRARVQDVEYLIPDDGRDVLVGVILDQDPR